LDCFEYPTHLFDGSLVHAQEKPASCVSDHHGGIISALVADRGPQSNQIENDALL
jgi:hypothetical protein